jgi:mRNA interferase RelE/StbE
MELVLDKRAVRRLRELPPKQRVVVMDRLRSIASEPFAKHPSVKPLPGQADLFRLRIGEWRAIYRLDRVSGIMLVTRIEPRGSAY